MNILHPDFDTGNNTAAFSLAKAIGSSPYFWRSGMDPEALSDAAFRGAGIPAIMGAGQQGMGQTDIEMQLDEMKRQAQLAYAAHIQEALSKERMQSQKLGFEGPENAANRAQAGWAKSGDWGMKGQELASHERVATANKQQDWLKFMMGENFTNQRQQNALQQAAGLAETTKESPLAKALASGLVKGAALAGEALREPNHPLTKAYWPVAQQIGDTPAEQLISFGNILDALRQGQKPEPIIQTMLAQKQAKANPQPSWWQRMSGGQ